VFTGERSGTGVNETQTEPQPWSASRPAEVVSRGYRRGLAWHEPATQDARTRHRAARLPRLASQALPSLSVRNACPADRRDRTCRIGALPPVGLVFVEIAPIVQFCTSSQQRDRAFCCCWQCRFVARL
jgi:hypothetical protein